MCQRLLILAALLITLSRCTMYCKVDHTAETALQPLLSSATAAGYNVSVNMTRIWFRDDVSYTLNLGVYLGGAPAT